MTQGTAVLVCGLFCLTARKLNKNKQIGIWVGKVGWPVANLNRPTTATFMLAYVEIESCDRKNKQPKNPTPKPHWKLQSWIFHGKSNQSSLYSEWLHFHFCRWFLPSVLGGIAQFWLGVVQTILLSVQFLTIRWLCALDAVCYRPRTQNSSNQICLDVFGCEFLLGDMPFLTCNWFSWRTLSPEVMTAQEATAWQRIPWPKSNNRLHRFTL